MADPHISQSVLSLQLFLLHVAIKVPCRVWTFLSSIRRLLIIVQMNSIKLRICLQLNVFALDHRRTAIVIVVTLNVLLCIVTALRYKFGI